MGFALEKLGAEECTRIAEELLGTPEKRYGTKTTHKCPFHGDEKTVSFFYEPEKDRYGCSSCGVYGDLIKLYSHIMGLDSKTDGFKAFCREYGITGKGPAGTRRPRPAKKADPPKVKGFWKRPH